VGRTVFIGDAHGCLDELDELVRTVGLEADDRVVMLGDMLDRGPDPVGVIRRVRERGWRSILGNHEDRALRWLRAESERVLSGRPNNMHPPYPQRKAEWDSLSSADLEWMRRLPLTITVGRWTAVHAGFRPGQPMYEQEADDMLHIRYVDASGRPVPINHVTMQQPPNTVFWTEAWKGPECVVYGHSTVDVVRIDRGPLESVCAGLDTGCVYGGLLTAAVTHGNTLELVSVKAAREYFSYDDRVGPPGSSIRSSAG
jgi:bis(5'-nucleosyl)-tetraphosphatase (symmetrical)